MRRISSDYAAAIGWTLLAVCIGGLAGCDGLACEPTGYAHWGAAASPHAPLCLKRPDEIMAGIKCELKE